MVKMKAYLVTISPTTRVLANSKDEAVEKAIKKIISNSPDYISAENIEKVEEDTVIPYMHGETID